MKQAYIAVDYGGGSGRVIAGSIVDGSINLDEVHRFANRQIALGDHIYWDFLSLFEEMIVGLRKAIEAGYHIESIGIDTWGVDFGFIDKHGNLMANPVCYRDPDINGCAESFFATHQTPAEHYSEAGLQIMDINSIFRLAKLKTEVPEMLSAASAILFTPDLFCYFLTGKASVEYTIASTSGLIDAATRSWNRKIINQIGLPEHLFGEIVMPGTIRGHLTDSVKKQIGIEYDIPVVAVGSHDTASAVHATGRDYTTDGTAFLSSGTWSLLGVVIDQPILTEAARNAGFSNEGGVGGKICFLQNITGLWILQRLISEWDKQGLPTDYPTLLREADNASISSIINVDDNVFHSPASMIAAIADYCRSLTLPIPKTQGEYVRTVLQSLAERYNKGIDGLNALLPSPLHKLQIIGGGSRNELLNRLTAEATGLEVIAGPVEATAIGNIMTQISIK